MKLSHCWGMSVGLLVAWSLASLHGAELYRVTQLTALPGGTNSNYARALNNHGEVVGRAGADQTKPRSFRWSERSGTQSFTELEAASYSTGARVNDRGDVAGSYDTENAVRPYLRLRDGSVGDLGLLSGDTCGEAIGINNAGHVVGYSSGSHGMRAVLWTPERGIEDLGTLPGGSYSKAVQISQQNAVVGNADSVSGKRAFLWTRGAGMQDLGTLPGDSSAEATAVGDRMTVAGHSTGAEGTRPFLWNRERGMRALDALPGGKYSSPASINRSGAVVGLSDSPLGARAVIWARSGELKDLNALVQAGAPIVLTSAVGINDRGEIVAIGFDASCQCSGTEPTHQCTCNPAGVCSASSAGSCCCPTIPTTMPCHCGAGTNLGGHGGHDNPVRSYLLSPVRETSPERETQAAAYED